MSFIDAFSIYRLDCPLGRMIGDNSCYYDEMVILVILLKTNDGHEGWGYSEVMTKGTFMREAWWVKELPEIRVLKKIFEDYWWSSLNKKNPLELTESRKSIVSVDSSIDKAVRLALWDLVGQCLNKPLYKLLGNDKTGNTVKAYGSPLDFHLSDDDTVKLVRKFIDNGFSTIKVKIGDSDPQKDINRLKLVKDTAGSNVEITADANEAWTWEIALKRLEQFESAGITLKYLEDPIYRTDINGIRELTSRSPIPIIGDDYLDNVDDVEIMIKEGGINGIRTFKDFDYMLGCIKLSQKYNLPVYIGNSQFEISIHAAVAFPEVKMIEFADLGWNQLVQNPIKFNNGYAIAPDIPGHGLVPKKELLNFATR